MQFTEETNIQTMDIDTLSEKTGNIFESIAIISKRSHQLSAILKDELDENLKQFEREGDNLEEIFDNKEQIKISRFYEKMPKSTLIALDEFLNDELAYTTGTEENE